MKPKILVLYVAVLFVTVFYAVYTVFQTINGLWLIIVSAGLGWFVLQLVKHFEKKPKTEFEKKTYKPGFFIRIGVLPYVGFFILIACFFNNNIDIGDSFDETMVISKKIKQTGRVSGHFLRVKSYRFGRRNISVHGDFWQRVNIGDAVSIRFSQGLFGFYRVESYEKS